ncbi:MAG: hypothetical protein CL610_02385 [Anaerolineaceae bacterium]|nr:hypothetical protein [Anaerolineaceae bacterium]
MQFRHGALVFSLDDREVGRIERVVLDPLTKRVTHVVIRQGLLLPEDKVIPMSMFQVTEPDRAVLYIASEDLHNLPQFEEEEFVPVEYVGDGDGTSDLATSLYWYPSVDMPYGAGPDVSLADELAVPERRYVRSTRQNIPEDTIALREGARVVSLDGRHIGNVERIVVDPATEYATHMLISQGLLLKTRKLVPVTWLKIAGEDEVHLVMGTETIQGLPPYRDPEPVV